MMKKYSLIKRRTAAHTLDASLLSCSRNGRRVTAAIERIYHGKFDQTNKRCTLLSGMSLIEVLVAVTVLAIGLSAIIGLQTATSLTSYRSNHQSMATFLVESQVEYLKAMGSDNVQFVSQSPEKLTQSGLPCTNPAVEPFVFTRIVTVLPGVPHTFSHAVHIRVDWDGAAVVYDCVIL